MGCIVWGVFHGVYCMKYNPRGVLYGVYYMGCTV